MYVNFQGFVFIMSWSVSNTDSNPQTITIVYLLFTIDSLDHSATFQSLIFRTPTPHDPKPHTTEILESQEEKSKPQTLHLKSLSPDQ